MKRIILRIVAMVLALWLFAAAALAEIPDPNDDFWYLDNANVLSDETEGEIFFGSEALYSAAGAGIVIVTVDSTEDTGIDDYTYQLFNSWDICSDTYYGMLLVMAIEDDDYYAMPGTKLETLIPAGDLSELLTTYLEPDFAKKDYDAGVVSFYEAAFARVSDELKLELNVEDAKTQATSYIAEHSESETTQTTQTRNDSQNTADYAAPAKGGSSFMGLLIVIVILLIVFGGTSYGAHRRRRGAPPPIIPPMDPHPPRRRRPPMGGFGGNPGGGRPPRGGGSSFFGGRPGGAPRGGGFGGRPGGAPRGGGFGGSSHRSGGGGHGPASRGGGAGRGR